MLGSVPDGGTPVEPMNDEAMVAAMEFERQRTATERDYFEAHVDEWAMTHGAEFVLIKQAQSHGFFPTFEQAFETGDRLFPEQDLFIKKVASPGGAEPVSLGLLHGVLVVDE